MISIDSMPVRLPARDELDAEWSPVARRSLVTVFQLSSSLHGEGLWLLAARGEAPGNGWARELSERVFPYPSRRGIR